MTRRQRIARTLAMTLIGMAVVSQLVVALEIRSLQSEQASLEYTSDDEFVPGRLLVRFEPGSVGRERAAAHAAVGARPLKEFGAVPGLQLIELPDSVPVDKAMKRYAASPAVRYAEPDYIRTLSAVPNDPRYGELWGLENTGQTSGTVDADIDAEAAWDRATGDDSVVVAVIDTGVHYTHPDLAANMWQNPGEIAGNGVDDDANGYVDDVYGIDTIDGDSDPLDKDGHGTHVAGTIGAVGNNGVGVVGVNWDVGVMAVRIFNARGRTTISAEIEAIEYAGAMGADVINCSWGGGPSSQAEKDAITAVDALFCFAAGNDGTDNDTIAHYPASYAKPNILAVAASTHDDTPASFSNYGLKRVDVFAPGEAILSTYSFGTEDSRVFFEPFDDLSGWDLSSFAQAPWSLETTVYVSPSSAAGHVPYADSEVSYIISDAPISIPDDEYALLKSDVWMDLEHPYDYLAFYVSTDSVISGSDYYGGISASGAQWYYDITADLSDYVGQDVWLAWALRSDSSNSSAEGFDGVRLDDVEVWTGDYESGYTTMNGTSMAAPHAAGLAALMLSESPDLSVAELKALIMDSAEPVAALSGLCVTGARIDAAGARELLGDVDPPETTATLEPSTWTSADVTVTLSATDTESGVASTHYTVGPSAPATYSGAFVVTNEGATPVGFWSVDTSGNIEPTRTATARIDRSPPVTTDDNAGTYEDAATVRLFPTDPLSGVAGTAWRFVGSAWTSGTVVQTSTVGTHDVEYRSTDVVGHVETTRSISFTIQDADPELTVIPVPAGADVWVELPGGGSMVFPVVTSAGNVYIRLIDPPREDATYGWRHVSEGYWEIEVDAAFTGVVDLTLPFDPADVPESLALLRLYHWDGETWEDVTVSVDDVANTITGAALTFSDYATQRPEGSGLTEAAAVPGLAYAGLVYGAFLLAAVLRRTHAR